MIGIVEQLPPLAVLSILPSLSPSPHPPCPFFSLGAVAADTGAQVERYCDDTFFAFTRGKALVALTNVGSTGGDVKRTITYHPYSDGTKVNCARARTHTHTHTRCTPFSLLGARLLRATSLAWRHSTNSRPPPHHSPARVPALLSLIRAPFSPEYHRILHGFDNARHHESEALNDGATLWEGIWFFSLLTCLVVAARRGPKINLEISQLFLGGQFVVPTFSSVALHSSDRAGRAGDPQSGVAYEEDRSSACIIAFIGGELFYSVVPLRNPRGLVCRIAGARKRVSGKPQQESGSGQSHALPPPPASPSPAMQHLLANS